MCHMFACSHVQYQLTKFYGVGQSRANAICASMGLNPLTRVEHMGENWTHVRKAQADNKHNRPCTAHVLLLGDGIMRMSTSVRFMRMLMCRVLSCHVEFHYHELCEVSCRCCTYWGFPSRTWHMTHVISHVTCHMSSVTHTHIHTHTHTRTRHVGETYDRNQDRTETECDQDDRRSYHA